MEEQIAIVWSFKNDLAEIPYKIISKGSTKKDGGKGIIWSCSCPHFVNRGKRTCKHLTTLKEKAKDGTILSDDRYQLTDIGKAILKVQ